MHFLPSFCSVFLFSSFPYLLPLNFPFLALFHLYASPPFSYFSYMASRCIRTSKDLPLAMVLFHRIKHLTFVTFSSSQRYIIWTYTILGLVVIDLQLAGAMPRIFYALLTIQKVFMSFDSKKRVAIASLVIFCNVHKSQCSSCRQLIFQNFSVYSPL